MEGVAEKPKAVKKLQLLAGNCFYLHNAILKQKGLDWSANSSANRHQNVSFGEEKTTKQVHHSEEIGFLLCLCVAWHQAPPVLELTHDKDSLSV